MCGQGFNPYAGFDKLVGHLLIAVAAAIGLGLIGTVTFFLMWWFK